MVSDPRPRFSAIVVVRSYDGRTQAMRIIVTGDRFGNCHKIKAAILRRLAARYGPGS
jgi:hypothetical protein